MTEKRGAKPIVSDSNIIVIKKLIIDFDEKHNMKSKVAIKDISDYFRMLSENNSLEFKSPSYSWWKTKGKPLIDEYNEVKKKTIRVSEGENIDTSDLIDAIEKYGGPNKEILRKLISPTVMIISRLEDKIIALEKKLEKLNGNLSENIISNKSLVERNDKLQDLVYSLFSYNQQDDSLKSFLTLGKTKSEAVNLSLKQTFVDPVGFFRGILEKKINLNSAPNEMKSNVIELKETKDMRNEKKRVDFDY